MKSEYEWVCKLTEILDADREAAHSMADAIIVELLHDIGYSKMAEIYEEGTKEWWYAGPLLQRRGNTV
jgi:hypothetical protein